MDDHRFDSVVKAIASSASRRGILGGGAAILLAGTITSDDALAKKKKHKHKHKKKNGCANGKQKCHGKCISKSKCCKDKDCKNGGVCQGGACTCGTGTRLCGTVCIPAANCCDSTDCVGANAGTCDSGTCVAGFQVCTKPADAPPVDTAGTAEVTFVTGSESPGQSGNSAEFSVGADGRDWAHLRSALFAGVKLDDLETLKYTTYTPDGGHCDNSPYMAIYVTSATGGNDILLYDPGVSETPGPVCGEWQTWDARNGLWRSIFHSEFAPQNDPQPLNDYQTEFGTVTLRNQDPGDSDCPTAFGGLRLEAGENNPADPTGGWQNFVGFVDTLEIKLAGQGAQTFNF